MLDEMRVNDEQLEVSDIRRLESADEIAHFFARLRYDVDERTNIPDYAVLGMGSEDMRQHIHKIELIGKDPEDGDISIYLFEVRSVTAKLRNDIARRFRERPEKATLVLTKNYEALEFVMLERVLSRSQSRRTALKQAIRPIPLMVNRLNPTDPVALRVLKRFTFTEEDADYQWEKLRSAYMLAEWSEAYFNNRALFSDYYLKERLTDPKITPAWDEDVRPVGREIYKHIVTARKSYTRQTKDIICKGLYEPVFKLLGFDFRKQKPGTSSAGQADYLLYTPGDTAKPIAAALTYVWNRNLDDVDEARECAEDDSGTPFEIPGARVVSLLEAQVTPWVIVTNGKLWRLYSSTASNKATNYYEIDLEEAIAANDQITALKYWWLMFRQQAFAGFLDDAALATVFSGTMTFLYRLMFILYAESLELLPVHEVHGYREHSLYRMKHEIADAGGTVLDESPDKLGKQYKTGSTELYDRLKALFTVIDQGSDELNMPTYNGGLFSQETDSGQFLATYAIPDGYLALGLDRLTRDVDDRTKALVFIDFKSLGVRHLGSIYEGLLEFKLQIAREKLAVTKDKGKEVYKPAEQVKKPLATIDQGEVYLENDKQERKATGSYYTPDYIVKYIVRHTVGPVLDRKFAELEKRLREAQRGYRRYARLVEARRKSTGRDESAAVYWKSSEEMRNLVDDCLNVRVLDPAMGSGHFLVEVVDYVTNRLIDFLNGWSENPVWAFLEQTRDDILNDMERQRVTIDADRLTRVSLLKRAVLKRCVYDVDLNAMAVELAKVSLWLDAFTLGAPLSFLDHHLKHGNSLIGARVADVQKALEGDLTLFSRNKFAGVMLATNLMRQVSYLSDNTVEQSRQSAQAYRDARDHLAPYKRVLDVYTSRWFGNTPSKNRKGATFDPTVEFLRRDDTQAWLEDPHNPKNCLPDDDYMQAGLVAKTALNAAEGKCFFHWELEFPEVFFASSRLGGQDVQLRRDGGFDVVVGNPPYVRPHNIEEEPKRYYQEVFETYTHKSDLLVCFFEITQYVLRLSGYCGMITSDTWMFLDSFQNLRQMLLNRMTVTSLVPFDAKDIFEDAAVCPVVVTYTNGIIEQKKIFIGAFNKANEFEILAEIAHVLYKITYKNVFDLSLKGKIPEIKHKIAEIGIPLGEITEVDFGLKTGDDQKFISFEKELDIDKPLVRGDDTYRYYIDFKGEYVHYDTEAICGILNSTLMKWYYETTFPTVHVQRQELSTLPIFRIKFTTPAEERQRLTREAIGAYDIGDNTGLLRRVQAHIDSGKTDVVHDLLAHLAQHMIDFNKQKQAEVKRYLTWVEERLKIQPDKHGAGGIESLTGKTILQGYLGNYQKGEGELPWREFHYRLYQNRNRFAILLSDVEGEIQHEYEKSLETLIPIKRDLARTDALIDKIVYRLYELTDEEIELIERPQYEQALADAKAQVVADDKIKDDEEKIEKIAEGILPAAKRFFERVEPKSVEEMLDSELPTWRSLPPDTPTFLLTGDYSLRTLPDHMDFSASVISYAKAVEVVLSQRIFMPFRQQYTDVDCRNDFLKRFMREEKDLTLGSFMIILSSSQETALRNFISRTIPDATNRVFGTNGLVTVLNDDAMRDIRNKAAHDEVLSRNEAQEARVWAMQILRQV